MLIAVIALGLGIPAVYPRVTDIYRNGVISGSRRSPLAHIGNTLVQRMLPVLQVAHLGARQKADNI